MSREIEWDDVLRTVDRRVDTPLSAEEALEALEALQSEIDTRIEGLKCDVKRKRDAG